MPSYETHLLYDGKVTILFDPVRHAYYIEEDGKKRRLKGCTTILQRVNKPALIPWAVKTALGYVKENLDSIQLDPSKILELARAEVSKQKDVAAEIGSAIHEWVHNHVTGKKPSMPEDPFVLEGVNAFLEWFTSTNATIKESERIVYFHAKKTGIEYVGRMDMIIEIDGKEYLADIKTGNAIYDEAYLQTAAYANAYEQEFGKKLAGRLIVRISKETEDEFYKRTGKTEGYKRVEPVFILGRENHSRDLSGFFGACFLDKCLSQLSKWEPD